MIERAVVIPRPRAQAAPLAQAVRALGRRAVVLPLLEIAPLDDNAPLRAALAGLVRELDPDTGLARLQAQHLIVPHARIAETARALGCDRITLTGSGDARLLAAIQSQE